MTEATSDTSVNRKSAGGMISHTGRGNYPTIHALTLNVHLVDMLVIFFTFEQV